MIILSKKPVHIAEAKELSGDLSQRPALEEYFKKFSKLSKEKSDKLYEEINALNNPKIKEENIIKVVDFLPQNSEEVNKIFNDVGLTEDETNSILAIVTKY